MSKKNTPNLHKRDYTKIVDNIWGTLPSFTMTLDVKIKRNAQRRAWRKQVPFKKETAMNDKEKEAVLTMSKDGLNAEDIAEELGLDVFEIVDYLIELGEL